MSQTWAGVPSALQKPMNWSKSERCTGDSTPSRLTRFQNLRSCPRAPSGPPSRQPSTRTTAFIEPALAPVIASIASRPSSISWSSTPQVKAPCAPPPWSASEIVFLAFGPASPRGVEGFRPARPLTRWPSHLPRDHHLLDLGDGLCRVQALRAGVGAVHDRVAAIEPERIMQVVEALAGGFVAAVDEPAIGLKQGCGAQEPVAVPPVA